MLGCLSQFLQTYAYPYRVFWCHFSSRMFVVVHVNIVFHKRNAAYENSAIIYFSVTTLRANRHALERSQWCKNVRWPIAAIPCINFADASILRNSVIPAQYLRNSIDCASFTLPWQWSLIMISQENHSFHLTFPTDHCRLMSIFRRNVRWRSEHV